MKQKYCLPIIRSKISEVEKVISRNQKSFDFFEIWLDYIKDLNLGFIENLKKKYRGRLIFLFRRQNLESPKMDFRKKIEIINLFLNSDCFLDLDIFSQKKEIEYLIKNIKGVNLILSYHNYKETPSNEKLKGIIQLMIKQKANIYKISTFCKKDRDALRLIDINASLTEKGLKCVVLGMGKKGFITRIAATFLDNEFIFAPVSTQEKSADGQLTKDALEKILKKIKVCYFIADPAEHSMSPQMHTAGYKALGIENNFLYLRKRVESENLKKFIDQIRTDPNFRGASISIPHKVEIIKYLDKVGSVAKRIGAVNTILKDNKGKLKGYNTDWLGIVNPLKQKVSKLKAKNVAIIGAGGTARAAVYALTNQGCKVVIFNRNIRKAQKLASEFNCKFDSIKNIGKISTFDIIIHATKVGLNPADAPLITKNLIRPNQIIFDVVYSKDYPETNLIKEAHLQKSITISGIEMLLHQGIAQFELFTKKKAPLAAMRKALI